MLNSDCLCPAMWIWFSTDFVLVLRDVNSLADGAIIKVYDRRILILLLHPPVSLLFMIERIVPKQSRRIGAAM